MQTPAQIEFEGVPGSPDIPEAVSRHLGPGEHHQIMRGEVKHHSQVRA